MPFDKVEHWGAEHKHLKHLPYLGRGDFAHLAAVEERGVVDNGALGVPWDLGHPICRGPEQHWLPTVRFAGLRDDRKVAASCGRWKMWLINTDMTLINASSKKGGEPRINK